MNLRAVAAETTWNSWSWYWLGWLLILTAAFLGPELYALASRHPENTLSAQVWRLEQVKAGEHIWQWSAGHFLIGGIIAVFLVWLLFHFVLGIWH